MAGAFAGGVLAQHFSDTALLVLFALMMLATSIAMLTGRMPRTKASTGEPARGGLLAVEGAVVGLFTGLVGAGGGFLVVPALVLLARLEMRRAIGTSLVIIVLKSSAGLAGHLSHVSFDWTLALTLSLTAAAGAVIGGALAAKVSSCSLRRGFGGLVLAMGLLVLGLQLPAGVLGLLGKHATWFGTGVLLLSGVVLAAWHYIRKHAQGSDTREAPAPSGLPPSAETDLHGGAPGAM
jgi:uncharacterized membrane protein YfcA